MRLLDSRRQNTRSRSSRNVCVVSLNIKQSFKQALHNTQSQLNKSNSSSSRQDLPDVLYFACMSTSSFKRDTVYVKGLIENSNELTKKRKFAPNDFKASKSMTKMLMLSQ